MALVLSLLLVACSQAKEAATIIRGMDPSDHRMHSEMERIDPSKLRVHPSLMRALPESVGGIPSPRLRSSRSHQLATTAGGNDAVAAAFVASTEEDPLPVLTVDRSVVSSCLGGRVHVNLTLPARFPRNNSDWVGLYSPSTADVNSAVPVKMATLGNLTHFPTSYGGPGPVGYMEGLHNTTQLKFDLVNLRGDFRFVFFSSSSWWYGKPWFADDPAGSAVAVAVSEPVSLVPASSSSSTTTSFLSTSPASLSQVLSNEGSEDNGGGGLCASAGVRPRVLPHVDSLTRRAVPGSWDVVWTSGDASPPAVLYFGDSPNIACSSSAAAAASATVTTATATPRATAASSSATYEPHDLCGSPANSFGWFAPGTTHTATLSNVQAGAVVYYCFDDLTENTETNTETEAATTATGTGTKTAKMIGDPGGVYSFKAPPETSTSTSTVPRTVLAAFADFGRGTKDDSDLWHEYGSPAVGTAELLASEALAGTIDAVTHFGDISYATGYLASWDYYLDMASSFTSRVPYMINVGNHEYNWNVSEWVGGSSERPASFFDVNDSGGECGVPTMTHIPLPLWWSADVGAIHVIAMCTEVNFTRGSDQWSWLLRDLKQVNRSLTPWVLFGGHRPMYVDSDYAGNPAADHEVMALLINEVEPLLVAFNVTLALWGHNHAVQRQCACVKGQCVQASVPLESSSGVTIHLHTDPPAPVHMLVGTGGAAFTKNAQGDKPFNEFTTYKWGYARITAHNASYLEWEFVDSQQQEEEEEKKKQVEAGEVGGGNGGGSGGDSGAAVKKGVVVDRMAIEQDPRAIVASIRQRNPYPDHDPPAPVPTAMPTISVVGAVPTATPSVVVTPAPGGGGGGVDDGDAAMTTTAAVGIVCGAAVLLLLLVVGRLAFLGRLTPALTSSVLSTTKKEETHGNYVSMGVDDLQQLTGVGDDLHVGDGSGGGGGGDVDGKSLLLKAFDAAYESAAGESEEEESIRRLSTIDEENRDSALSRNSLDLLPMSDL